MGKFTESALLLLLSFMLAYASMGVSTSERVPQQVYVTEAGVENAQSSFSQSLQIKFHFLNKSDETVVSSVRTVAGSSSKDYRPGALGIYQSIEQRIQSLVLQDLLRSNGICRSLSPPDIVFPFHYFW
ncbi:hypothetical protein ACFSRY_13020 [Pontibacter locisalis]|uniref:Uncharacterized protein n=1 Tax=Pontibacter locisalis TaxID=1719035 RepID=A0ABW5IRZ7_9BACT